METKNIIDKVISFSIHNKVITFMIAIIIMAWGIYVAPFEWNFGIPRSPIPVDAIPDIGENQQIVYTKWEGRSPQDIEDQISYPLTVALMGIADVKTVRSFSMFGFSSIYVVFKDKTDFYWSRSRIMEKLASLPANLLPEGVKPTLGPDATALGQVFWYTLEGRDKDGNPAPGWDLHELRSIQDWQVRYSLMAAEGVSEVASVGGFVKEYQIDVNPDIMKLHNITLPMIYSAIKKSNKDIGARTIEINSVEYVIRGLGLLQNLNDIEKIVIKNVNNIPITIKDIAVVTEGPAPRRGILDKEGAEAVGGVVVTRYGENPLAVIKNIKTQINQISSGLPEKTLEDGRISKVTIVPFYDRSGLIRETLNTLNEAIVLEILITIIVVMVMINTLGSSLIISLVLPMAVLISFIGMKLAGVDANIVSLSGIAIAIGTIVDMGIILSENVLKHFEKYKDRLSVKEIVYNASSEVGSAILTAVLTTVVSFLPVFTMEAAEGKLFKPLAYTKTFALLASVLIALTLLPPLLSIVFKFKRGEKKSKFKLKGIINIFLIAVIGIVLTARWRPLGLDRAFIINLFLVISLVGGLLYLFNRMIKFYPYLLRFFLNHKPLFLIPSSIVVILGLSISFTLGKEFMPPLDEGSYLYMPTTMVHASIGEVYDIISKQDQAISSIPEIENAVGKLGRAESPLDPAPVSMIETIINIKPEYKQDEKGKILRFKYNRKTKKFVVDENSQLVRDKNGKPFRQWRSNIKTMDDIWDEIVKTAQITGVTSAPKLQPIAARIVMLQSGMRAPMGIKVSGNNLDTIESFSLKLEKLLKEVPSVQAAAVFADRIVGKPYLEININRSEIARYGLQIDDVQNIIESAMGGKSVTSKIEGRERYSVRVRYQRELRGLTGDLESIKRILIPINKESQIPLELISSINYRRGPQVIKSEDTFLTGYVLFDRQKSVAEVNTVNEAADYIRMKIKNGSLKVPNGVSYRFAGSYENQVRSEKRLMIILPLALFIIFMILYMQFKKFSTTLLVFSSILVAWSGGFIMIWLYGQEWFLNFVFIGISPRDLFNIHSINLSVAIWVGFLALFGIASDDGVVICTYLEQRFKDKDITTKEEIRELTIEAASRRVRPALMTSATTILALLPILTSTGRGSDVMIPMAIPSFGGMMIELLTIFMVPVLYSSWNEFKLKLKSK